MTSARVLHVFKHFRPHFTGEGIFVERLAPVFAALRPDIAHDVAATATPRPAALAVPEGLGAIHYLADSRGEANQRALVTWLARNARRYQVVHYHTHVDRSFAGSLLLRLSGARLLLSATLDDSIPGILATYRGHFRPVVRILMRTIHQFIAISEKLFHENNRLAPADKSTLLPIGIAIPELSAQARRKARETLGLPAAILLVSVGGICERKNQLFLVENLPALVQQHPELVLLLVGPVLDPAYKARIDDSIARLGLARNVRFYGYAEAPWDFYTAADIMVFASKMEGFGTVVIEAMAYGLPVVAWRLPGVNEMFIEHGRSGYLFNNPDLFRLQVSALAASPALRSRIGAAARSFVASRYDITVIAARYLALYGFPAAGAAS